MNQYKSGIRPFTPGIEDPDELVTELEEVISDSVYAPEQGQFCIFLCSKRSRYNL